ncbi:MAG: hypothetical protein AMDU4_FER2C00096G0005 [Ferroplasma sp. Type II]|nr:MAG: hypothetical protein AMDU4_FER2C00096G0005 [Ferroplasma sp. Type II]
MNSAPLIPFSLKSKYDRIPDFSMKLVEFFIPPIIMPSEEFSSCLCLKPPGPTISGSSPLGSSLIKESPICVCALTGIGIRVPYIPLFATLSVKFVSSPTDSVPFLILPL